MGFKALNPNCLSHPQTVTFGCLLRGYVPPTARSGQGVMACWEERPKVKGSRPETTSERQCAKRNCRLCGRACVLGKVQVRHIFWGWDVCVIFSIWPLSQVIFHFPTTTSKLHVSLHLAGVPLWVWRCRTVLPSNQNTGEMKRVTSDIP